MGPLVQLLPIPRTPAIPPSISGLRLHCESLQSPTIADEKDPGFDTTMMISPPAEELRPSPVRIQQKVVNSPIPMPLVPSVLLDRTSFDETDSFQVDKTALESPEWIKTQHRPLLPPPVVLRNGKVKRRLLWRPKAIVRRRRPRAPPPMPISRPARAARAQSLPDIPLGSTVPSSSSSVVSTSNTSQSSRNSRRSMHSLASLETQVKSNRGKNQTRHFPRPNFLTPFETKMNPITGIGSASGEVIGTTSSGTKPILTTAVSEPANVEDCRDETVPLRYQSSPTSRLPPRPRLIRANSDSTAYRSPPVVLRKNSERSINGMRTSNQGSKVSFPDLKIARSSPASLKRLDIAVMPALSGDDFERERVVDLRIRVSGGSPPSQYEPEMVSIAELRSSGELVQDEMESLSSCDRGRASGVVANSTRDAPSLDPDPIFQADVTSIFRTRSEKWNNNVQEMRSRNLALVQSGSTSSGTDANSKASREIRFVVEQLPQVRRSISTSSNEDSPLPSFPTAPPTVPVDLDDGGFLDAERNLQAIHDMGTEHLQQGELNEALEVFEEILRGQLTRYGKDHYRVGTALHNIGIVYMRQGDYPKACRAYKEAINIRKRALHSDHVDVAASLAQLGVAYLERQMHKRAIASLREALKIRRNCLGNSHSKVAKVLNNIGCALYELNALEVAQVAFEEALEIQRKNLRDEPTGDTNRSNFSLLSVASTLSNIASIKLYCSMFDEARIDYEEALLIQQCVYGDDHPIPKQTHASIAWIEKAFAYGKSEEESDLFTKMLAPIGKETEGLLSCAQQDLKDTENVFSLGTDNHVILPTHTSDNQEPGVFQAIKALHYGMDCTCAPEPGSTMSLDENDLLDDDDGDG